MGSYEFQLLFGGVTYLGRETEYNIELGKVLDFREVEKSINNKKSMN